MTTRTDQVESLWEEDHAKHPAMAKDTFVRNCLFSGKVAPSDLGAWILDQDDLADRIWTGGSDGYFASLEVDPPEGKGSSEGRRWYQSDPNGPRVIVRIQMETLHSGESKLLAKERPPWECD